METYSGRARFTDDGGIGHDVAVEAEQINDDEWTGIIEGPLDWSGLLGERHLLLRLPERSGLPTVSAVHVDLAVDDRAIVHGVAYVDEPSRELVTTTPRKRTRRSAAIHWHEQL